MDEVISWAILFGKVWVIAQIIGYAIAIAFIIIAVIIVIKELCGR